THPGVADRRMTHPCHDKDPPAPGIEAIRTISSAEPVDTLARPVRADGRWRRGRSIGLLVEEALESTATGRVPQLLDGPRLDLADALAGDLEDAADFLQGVGIAVAQAIAELDHFALAVSQGLQDLVHPLREHPPGGGVDRAVGGLVLEEVAEMVVLVLA